MVYEIKVTQTVSGTIYVEGDNYEDAEKNARQFIKKDPKHVASIIFDETWVTEVGSQEASDESSNETKTNSTFTQNSPQSAPERRRGQQYKRGGASESGTGTADLRSHTSINLSKTARPAQQPPLPLKNNGEE